MVYYFVVVLAESVSESALRWRGIVGMGVCVYRGRV